MAGRCHGGHSSEEQRGLAAVAALADRLMHFISVFLLPEFAGPPFARGPCPPKVRVQLGEALLLAVKELL